MTTNPLRKTKKKGRANGDWKRLSASRAAQGHDLENGHGVSNIPGTQDVGSAAYRRLLKCGRTRRHA